MPLGNLFNGSKGFNHIVSNPVTSVGIYQSIYSPLLISGAALRGIVKDKEELSPKGFGIKAEDILQIYFDQAKNIFGEEAKSRLSLKIPVLDVNKYPTYEAKGLKTVINNVFGGGSVTKLGNTEKLLSISSYDVSSRKPHFFSSWKPEYKNLEIGDAVMASSKEIVI